MERRTFLAGAGTTLGASVGGCMLLGPTHEHNEDAWDVRRQQGSLITGSIEGKVQLDEGQYAALELNQERAAEYEIEITVTEGDEIDFFVMGSGSFEKRYQDGSDDLRFKEELSALETGNDVFRGRLTAGDYRIIVDNTAVYGAEPDGSIEVELDLEANMEVEHSS